MKLLVLFALCAVVAASPTLEKGHHEEPAFLVDSSEESNRNLLVNILVRGLFTMLRRIIREGTDRLPPLDPLVLDHYHLNIPAQIINLDLDLKNIVVTGFGGFVVHTSRLDLSAMTFDLRISVPTIHIKAGGYDLVGDFYSLIPLFGKGNAEFEVDNFVFAAKLHLKQSENEKSIIIDRIENASFEIPNLKSKLTGVIGGGDIDAIVNAITEDVIISYLNRFQGAIASTTSAAIVKFGNPLLETLDTWRHIAHLIPRGQE